MPDCVLDATVVGFANGDIAGRRRGNVFDLRLAAIEKVVNGVRRLRYNPRLLHEYKQLTRIYRNDVIELLFRVLADQAVLVRRNTLARQDYVRATRDCGWPSHDQHLLAAALGGIDPVIVVTEERHAQCAEQILRCFAMHVEHLV